MMSKVKTHSYLRRDQEEIICTDLEKSLNLKPCLLDMDDFFNSYLILL